MPKYTEPQLIENANGTWTSIGAMPIEPEPIDPKADRVAHSKILKEFRWTDEDWHAAQSYFGFPTSIGFTDVGTWMWSRRD